MLKGGGGAGADGLNLERLAEAMAFLRGLPWQQLDVTSMF